MDESAYRTVQVLAVEGDQVMHEHMQTCFGALCLCNSAVWQS